LRCAWRWRVKLAIGPSRPPSWSMASPRWTDKGGPVPTSDAAPTCSNDEGTTMTPSYHTALIVGAGSGLSASLARLFAREGMRVGLAARDAGKLAPIAAETGADTFTCDAAEP